MPKTSRRFELKRRENADRDTADLYRIMENIWGHDLAAEKMKELGFGEFTPSGDEFAKRFKDLLQETEVGARFLAEIKKG